MNILKINKFLFIVTLSFFSCSNYMYQNTSSKYEYEYEFEKYEPYLSIDSVYKTKEDKLKFEELKAQCIKVILDTSNCFLKRRLNGSYVYRNYSIENILHNENYDSLVVLFVIDWALFSSDYKKGKIPKRTIIESKPMRVIVDKNGKWNFVCTPIVYGNDGSPYSEEMLERVKTSMKRTIIRCSYFKKDLTPDPTFFYRIFTNPNIFVPDPINDGFPLN